jgi:hypothetical protein
MHAIASFFRRDAKVTVFSLALAVTLLFFAPWRDANSAGSARLSSAQQVDPPGKTKPLHAKGVALDAHTR